MGKKQTIQNEQSSVQPGVWLSHAARERFSPAHHADSASAPITSLRERESIRKAIPCTILVNFGTTYAIASNILDISLTGAYVALDAAGAQLGDAVEVVLSFEYQGKQIEHRIPSTIARLQSTGVGLKFGTYENQTYTDLVNLLYAA